MRNNLINIVANAAAWSHPMEFQAHNHPTSCHEPYSQGPGTVKLLALTQGENDKEG